MITSIANSTAAQEAASRPLQVLTESEIQQVAGGPGGSPLLATAPTTGSGWESDQIISPDL